MKVSVCFATLFVLLPLFAAAAEVKKDIEYGHAGDVRLLLDACVPEGAGPFPMAILVHGGGWSRGDKCGTLIPGDSADITPWFEPLTRANFTWFSINYRLAPQYRWPACLEDVQTAIRWVKAHAAEFKGDPQRIVLFGHSDGGHLVCLAAVLAGEDTHVQAVAGFAPVTDFEQELPQRGGLSTSLQALFNRPKEITPEVRALLHETSPINHLKAGLPAFLLLHGDADPTVPYVQSLNFQAGVRAAGGVCDLITIHGAPHALASWNKIDPSYKDRMIAWLRQRLPEPAPAAFAAMPAPNLPPRAGPNERLVLSDAATRTLEGWDGNPDWWSVKEGAFIAKASGKVPTSFLFTQRNYSDFRLVLWSRVVESENHAGVSLWGEQTPGKDATNRWAYKGLLVCFPGIYLWDYNTNKGIPIDPAGQAITKEFIRQHDWIKVEILAQGNRIRAAFNGRQVLDWREPDPGRLKAGPIGLQLHGHNLPQEVIYKDVVIETFPKEDRLITVEH